MSDNSFHYTFPPRLKTQCGWGCNPQRPRGLEHSCAYIVQGLFTPLIGTTLVHMERLFDSDTATMSWTFTMAFVGCLFGAVVCGFIFDRFNHDLLLMVLSGIQAATTAIAPFFTTLPLFIATMSIQATSQGLINTSKARLCHSV